MSEPKSTSTEPNLEATSSAPVSLRSSNLQSLVRHGPNSHSAGTLLPTRPLVTIPSAHIPRPKLKSTFTFSPNVPRTSQPPKAKAKANPQWRGVGKDVMQTSTGQSVQSLLAHQLAVQGTTGSIICKPRPQSQRIVSASLQTKLAQLDHMRNKKRSSNKSREILELSWPLTESGEDAALYTPISLPYVIRDTGEASVKALGEPHSLITASRKSQRPSIKHVDEANRDAAKIFEANDVDDGLNDWCLVQLPSLLPALDKEAMEKQREEKEDRLLTPEQVKQKQIDMSAEKRTTTGTHFSMLGQQSLGERYVPSAFSTLPEGLVGTIKIRRSGKVQMLMGDHLFDINQGSDCNFAQDVGCYIEGSSEFFFLGRCLKKMTITPDVQRSIRKTRVNH